eukprot:4985439-Pyramimonas_sp.AAC.1
MQRGRAPCRCHRCLGRAEEAPQDPAAAEAAAEAAAGWHPGSPTTSGPQRRARPAPPPAQRASLGTADPTPDAITSGGWGPVASDEVPAPQSTAPRGVRVDWEQEEPAGLAAACVDHAH